jgi:hypothetical protein
MFVRILEQEGNREVLQCLRCQRIWVNLKLGAVSRVCPYCTRGAVAVPTTDAENNVVVCAVCEKVIEDTVFVCDCCYSPVCLDCVRVAEEPYYGCRVFCLDCWVK